MIKIEYKIEDGNIPVKQEAKIYIHPKTAAASVKMPESLAGEFRRWMADEIEEIAELLDESVRRGPESETSTNIANLAEQLVEQAEMLGYPNIMEIAGRLRNFVENNPLDDIAAATLDDRVTELRAALRR